jgi:hypothetical protein
MKPTLGIIAAFLATSALAAPGHKQQPPVPSYPSFGASTESFVLARSGATIHRFSFTIAAGTDSSFVSIPKDKPALLMAVGDVFEQRGVGQVTIWNVHGGFLEWIGQDMQATEKNFGSTAGDHIMWLDFNAATLDVQVANDSQIKVHNASNATENVDLTLIY